MKTRCLIVDDEPLAIQALATLLNKLDTIEIVATCNDVFSAFNIIQNRKIDLLFLDIEMPEITGLELLKSLKNPPQVILVTAYREYALNAFDLNALDYLLKPVSFERLLQALDKYYQTRPAIAPEKASTPEAVQDKQLLDIKTDKKILRIPFHEIYYIESMKDYVKIKTQHGTNISKCTIKSLQETLPDNKFVRIHRSFIVNLEHIQSYTSNSIEIKQRELPIGRIYKSAVMGMLNHS